MIEDSPVNEHTSFVDRAGSVDELNGLGEILLQVLLRRVCSSDTQVPDVGLLHVTHTRSELGDRVASAEPSWLTFSNSEFS